MSTFAQWLRQQKDRPDEPGQLCRFFDSFEHGRISSLAGVTRAIIKQADIIAGQGHPELVVNVPHWISATTQEYRSGKQEDALGTAMGPRLDLIEGHLDGMRQTLELIRMHLQIPAIAAVPDAEAEVIPFTQAVEPPAEISIQYQASQPHAVVPGRTYDVIVGATPDGIPVTVDITQSAAGPPWPEPDGGWQSLWDGADLTAEAE